MIRYDHETKHRLIGKPHSTDQPKNVPNAFAMQNPAKIQNRRFDNGPNSTIEHRRAEISRRKPVLLYNSLAAAGLVGLNTSHVTTHRLGLLSAPAPSWIGVTGLHSDESCYRPIPDRGLRGRYGFGFGNSGVRWLGDWSRIFSSFVLFWK